MILPMYLGQVNQGIKHEHAQKVAAFLQVFSKHSEKLLMETKENVREIEETCRARLQSPWNEIVFHHIMACKGVEAVDFVSAHGDQNMAVTIFLREFPNMTNWPLEILYILNADLGRLAVQLKSHNLCKNILRAVKAADLPELEQFPMAHQVTIRYYTGVLSFFNDDFKKAESDLQFAFDHIPPKFHHNRRLVLHYLIPTRLLHGSLPSSRLLEEFPELSALYRPLALAIKTGNVQLFDEALSVGGSRLVGLGTYLTVERSRGVAVRVLFKKV
ncbi:COP9 signalosome (CSN) subunit, partial [Linnemannia gamsii]